MSRFVLFLFKISRFFLSGPVVTIDNGTSDPDDVSNSAVDPIYDAVTTFGPALIGLFATCMALYAAIMGFQYSKAESADDRNKAKKKLINGCVGFGVVLVLIIILYALRRPIINLINQS